jgi:hypothetical protein
VAPADTYSTILDMYLFSLCANINKCNNFREECNGTFLLVFCIEELSEIETIHNCTSSESAVIYNFREYKSHFRQSLCNFKFSHTYNDCYFVA